MVDGERLRLIDEALHSADTPYWGRIMLLCMRDDHLLLHRHIREHGEVMCALRKIVVAVVTAACIAVVMWVLASALPGVFG